VVTVTTVDTSVMVLVVLLLSVVEELSWATVKPARHAMSRDHRILNCTMPRGRCRDEDLPVLLRVKFQRLLKQGLEMTQPTWPGARWANYSFICGYNCHSRSMKSRLLPRNR
jgi:hypothetical protein